MKKYVFTYLILSLFALSSNIKAQGTILPLVEVGKKWNFEMGGTVDGTSSNLYGTTYVLSFVKDTTLSNSTYTILNITQVPIYKNVNCLPLKQFDTFYMRQDGNTVYYKRGVDSTERIMYKFDGVNVGDTIRYLGFTKEGHGCYGNNGNFKISSVDTIEVQGIKTRRFKIENNEGSRLPNYFIDGIGSSGAGIFSLTYDFFEGGTLLRCYQNATQSFDYHTDNGTLTASAIACNQILSIQDFDNKIENIFFERISETELKIVTTNAFETTVYNVGGNEVLKYSSVNGNILHLGNLASGFYVLKVQSTNGKISTFKIIK